MTEKGSANEVPPYIKELEEKNALASELIYKFLLENGDTRDNFLVTWHSKNVMMEDGRSVFVNAQALTGIKTWEEVEAKPNQGNALRIAIDSPKEGIVGYNIEDQIDNHEIKEYLIKTGPGTSCVVVAKTTNTDRYSMLTNYNKVLSLVAKALEIL